jgi:hypothetical protein
MVAILSAVVLIFVFRFRSRAALELKLVALQHQLAVLRRQRPGRPQLSSLDRLLSTSAICAAFYRAIFNIIMTPEGILRSARTAHGAVTYTLPRPAISSPSLR